MTPIPKIKPVRSKRYLDFIRSKPCVVCGKPGPSEAAHQSVGYRAMGSKNSDFYTVGLCHHCHSEQHRGVDLNVDFSIRCLEYINEFFSSGGKL